MFRSKLNLPLQLIIVIASVFLFGSYFDESLISFFYTFSLFFKEILSFFLPFIIFSFVVIGILSFKKNVPLILAVLVASIFLSNSIVAMLAYVVGMIFVPLVAKGMSVDEFIIDRAIAPFYTFKFPALVSSEHALLLAVAVGIGLSFIRVPRIERGIHMLKRFVETFLNYYFIPLLPLYVFGFLLEIHYKGVFASLFVHYGRAFVVIFMTQIAFIFLYYLLVAQGSIKKMWYYMVNAWPSYVTAFSTMSSTATIPISIDCAEKNIHNRPLAQISMPIMANIHLLGDSVSTPLLALVTMSLFTGNFPDIMTYMTFIFYFCTAMLAVSGIPGGGIIVMIPILISQLGFTEQMVSIITALYLLLDAFGTAANVMGDGALVILVKRILVRLKLI
jgi:Na+/H+-dicarboxylate symporter